MQHHKTPKQLVFEAYDKFQKDCEKSFNIKNSEGLTLVLLRTIVNKSMWASNTKDPLAKAVINAFNKSLLEMFKNSQNSIANKNTEFVSLDFIRMEVYRIKKEVQTIFMNLEKSAQKNR